MVGQMKGELKGFDTEDESDAESEEEEVVQPTTKNKPRYSSVWIFGILLLYEGSIFQSYCCKAQKYQRRNVRRLFCFQIFGRKQKVDRRRYSTGVGQDERSFNWLLNFSVSFFIYIGRYLII